MPPIREVRLVDTRSKAFSVAAPLTELSPLEAYTAPSLLVFRKRIKLELFKRAFTVMLINLIRCFLSFRVWCFSWCCFYDCFKIFVLMLFLATLGTSHCGRMKGWI